MEIDPLQHKERSCLSKRRYWSEIDALVIASRCMDQRRTLKLETYPCKNCQGWHLARLHPQSTDTPSSAEIDATTA